MDVSRLLDRARRRLHREQAGLTLIETLVALGVMLIALLALAHTVSVGFTDIGLSRQRLGANQIANKILEQVRGLSLSRVGQGLASEDKLFQDPNIVSCPDGALYYRKCPESDPAAEKIVHTAGLPDEVPMVPHKRSWGPPEFTAEYTSRLYVTQAKDVSGAYRVTVLVNWENPQRRGVRDFVKTQSLLYTPEGTTDPGTGAGGDAPFFYGTGSVGRGGVTVTPNPGVSGGVGVAGFGSWDSLSQDLYALEANVQTQSLGRAEGRALMTGGRKVVGGNETISGGETATSVADDDPATPTGTTQGPLGLMQSTVLASVTGGGNALDVRAASGTGGGPALCPTPQVRWMSGVETGSTLASNSGTGGGEFGGTAGFAFAHSSVKRSGSYSLRVSPFGAAYGVALAPSAADRHTVLHFAIRLDELPGSDVNELASAQVLSTTSYAALFGYEATSNRFMVRLRNGSNVLTAPVTSSNTVVAGQWYVIDLYWNSSGTTHTVDWRVDGMDESRATLTGVSAQNLYGVFFGSRSGGNFTANYDDMALSVTSADYPLPDLRIGRLLPDGMGPGNGNPGSVFVQGNRAGNMALNSNAWGYLDRVPMSQFDLWVIQQSNSTSNYAEVTFEDTTEGCIVGVRGFAHLYRDGNGGAHSRTDILEGTQTTTIFNGSPANFTSPPAHYSRMIGTAGGDAWTTGKVNGLVSRFGYSSDANPDVYWLGLQLQHAYVPGTGGTEGPPGTESGSTTSTTAASAPATCGNPTQVDGRACSYAKEDYTTVGPPFLRTALDLTGSGAGKCILYKASPTTQPFSTSYVWGRRTSAGGGAGTIRESATRYPGAHEFGKLCDGIETGPAGWPGYWVRYDAGTSSTGVYAEAGVGSTAPTFTQAGSISYWDGSAVSTMPVPPAGGEIPVAPLDYAFGGYRVEISGSVGTGPSSTEQVPPDAVGTTERAEARATVGSPVVGSFTYRVTNQSTGQVIADLTVAVDLGTLTATTRYAP